MTRFGTALLVGIFVALVGIGFELHRVANFLTGPLTLRSAAAEVAPTAPETRAQRNERLRREQHEFNEDARAIFSAK